MKNGVIIYYITYEHMFVFAILTDDPATDAENCSSAWHACITILFSAFVLTNFHAIRDGPKTHQIDSLVSSNSILKPVVMCTGIQTHKTRARHIR